MRRNATTALAALLSLALGVAGALAQDAGSPADIAFWNSVKDSRSAAEVQAYIDTFPNGTFVGLAKLRLEALRNPPPETRAAAPPPASVAPPQPPAPPQNAATTRPGSSDVIRMVQEKLYNLNYDITTRDGRMNTETREAIAAWRKNLNSGITGDITSAEIARLNDVVTSSTWGAAAYNARGGVSTNWNTTTRAEAEKKAMDGCKKLSGGPCKVLTTPSANCIAVSYSTGTVRGTTYYDAWAIGRTTVGTATDDALAVCRSKAHVSANCGIRATLCADGSHKK